MAEKTSDSCRRMLSPITADRPYFTTKDRLDEALALTTTRLTHGELSVGRYRRDRPNHGWMAPNPTSSTFMVLVAMRPQPQHVFFRDEQSVKVPEMNIGRLACFDLRYSWSFVQQHPFDSFHAFIPRSAFDHLTSELKQPKIEQLSCFVGDNCDDITMLNLARAIIPLMERPDEATSLITDYVFSAMVAHLASRYGGLRQSNVLQKEARRHGTLTPLQERRVTSRLLDDLKADPGLSELAALCGLSRSHFVRAYKQTPGMPPHRWLLNQRLSQVKRLLIATEMSLAEIALDCGFADQSHMTRVFSKTIGISPGAWRRQQK